MTRYEIWQKVEAENARSKEKYGLWASTSDRKQLDAIYGEIREFARAAAVKDIDGPHGQIIEAIQVINCMVRRIQFLTGEADA